MITKTESLEFLPLAMMKFELRIPDTIVEHDELVTGQICAAVSFISFSTDRPTAAEIDHAALRSAAILLCRELYNGYRDIKRSSAMYSLMAPFRRLAG